MYLQHTSDFLHYCTYSYRSTTLLKTAEGSMTDLHLINAKGVQYIWRQLNTVDEQTKKSNT